MGKDFLWLSKTRIKYESCLKYLKGENFVEWSLTIEWKWLQKVHLETSKGNYYSFLEEFLYSFVNFCFSAFTTSAPPVNKNKLTWLISCNHKALTTFHHDAPNSLAPGFKFLEFFVNDLSTRTPGEYAKNTRM